MMGASALRALHALRISAHFFDELIFDAEMPMTSFKYF